MSKKIESHLVEERVFKPSKEFSKKARISSMAQYRRMYKESIEKPSVFWAREAKELLWQKPWKKVLEWKAPFAKWFTGARINVCENCVDRHLTNGRKNKAAIIWEGEPGDKRVLTYQQLHREVCRFANILEANGVKARDRVLVYMPMVPEAAIAMLACARIGAVHSVVFGGFSAESISDRLDDSGAIAVITADGGGYRRGKVVPLKQNVDDALKKFLRDPRNIGVLPVHLFCMYDNALVRIGVELLFCRHWVPPIARWGRYSIESGDLCRDRSMLYFILPSYEINWFVARQTDQLGPRR